MKKNLKNALPLEKRTCFNCRLANIISKVFGEVYCKRFRDSPQGVYRNAIVKMDNKRKCPHWELKKERKGK